MSWFILAGIFLFSVSASVAEDQRWVGSWATAVVPLKNAPYAISHDGITIRNIVHLSLGGDSLRIRITNEFGTEPLTIGQVTVVAADEQGAISTPLQPVFFHGSNSIEVPAGAAIWSDPIPLHVLPLSDIAISLFVPAQTISIWTAHNLAMQNDAIASGNQASQPTLTEPTKFTKSFFVKSVDISCTEKCFAVAAFGDSITDGQGSTINKNSRWPNLLAERLQGDKHTRNVGVLNLGISGNRLLHDGTGPSALARLDRDVLAQSGVRSLIVLEGINDIGRATRDKNPEDIITVEDLEWALTQIADRVHAAGIRAFAATLTPAGHGSVKGEKMRTALNEWIRSNHVFDGYVDFDTATRDPQMPKQMLREDDSGDSLHPSDEGYRRMSQSIDLKQLTKGNK